MTEPKLQTVFSMPGDFDDLLLYLLGRNGGERPVQVTGLVDLRPDALKDNEIWEGLEKEHRVLKIPSNFGLDGYLHAVKSSIVEIGDNVRITNDCLLDRSKISSIGSDFQCFGTLRLKNCRYLSDASFPEHVTAVKTDLTGTRVTRALGARFSGEVIIDLPRTLSGKEPMTGWLRPVGYFDRWLGSAIGISTIRNGGASIWKTAGSFRFKPSRGATRLSFDQIQAIRGMSDEDVVRSARNKALLSFVSYLVATYCGAMFILHVMIGHEPSRSLFFVPGALLFAGLGMLHAFHSYQLWHRDFMNFRKFIRAPRHLIPSFSAPKGEK